ncbi:DUF4129 domain-containing protein [Daejeonia sp. YH14]|uniref:DUF4129 domain-containing protein n=1 Tax=Daejeonia sp. YH14 TaxID=3439042 RepID=UPI003F493340
MKQSKILCLFVCAVGWCSAQTEVPVTPYQKDSSGFVRNIRSKNLIDIDSALSVQKNVPPVAVQRTLDSSLDKKYRGNEFDYSANKPHESFMDRLKRRLQKLAESLFGKVDGEKAASFRDLFIRIFAIVILGLVLYFLIRFFAGKDGTLLFGKRNNKTGILADALHEDIHKIIFTEKIASLEQQNHYREAIRYQFLYILKKLSDTKCIIWNPEKTNKDYAGEIADAVVRQRYNRLSYIFENVWYGEFPVDKAAYDDFRVLFNDFVI